jgi:hypothetical protein
MPWMDILIEVEGSAPVKNAINVDQIVRFGPRTPHGSYIKMSNGDSLQVLDPYDEILHTVLTAETKKDSEK